jgi:hypothetical protein
MHRVTDDIDYQYAAGVEVRVAVATQSSNRGRVTEHHDVMWNRIH